MSKHAGLIARIREAADGIEAAMKDGAKPETTPALRGHCEVLISSAHDLGLVARSHADKVDAKRHGDTPRGVSF